MLYKSDYHSKLSILEFDAYQRVFDLKFHPTEIEILFSLDREYTIALNEVIRKRTPQE